MRKRYGPIILPLVTFMLFIGVWHYAVLWTQTKIFPPPRMVLLAIAQLSNSGSLVPYMRDSLMRVALGFGVAAIFAIPLGLFMGLSRPLRVALSPVIQIMRPISPLAWVPLSIVFFGLGTPAVVFLIFLASFFPLVMSTTDSIADVPLIYTRAGRNFGLEGIGLLRHIVLPAALPRIITGLRIALGVSWLVVVAAEMIAVDSGLGYLILDARNAGKRYDLVIAGMIIIGIIGLFLDIGLRRLERLKFLRWSVRSAP